MRYGSASLQNTKRRQYFVLFASAVVLLSTTLWPLWTEPAFGYQGEGKPAENGGADQDPAAADPQDSTDPPPPERESFLSVVANANGLLFGPSLLLMSFIMVALVVMNTLQMRRSILLPEEFVESFGERLTAKDYQGAYDLARNDDSFVARVLAAGLSKLNRGYSEAIEGMQEVGEEENMVLDHKVNYLALIGSIAPMIGLMGTVWGMIGAFEDIATSPTQPKPKDLAQNIYTALFTTLEGLMIAVPAIVACSLLRNQVSRIVLEIGIVSEGLMGRFSAVGRSGAGSPAVSTAAAQADDSGTKP